MRANELRAKLERNQPDFGPVILELASPGLPEIFAAAGADFIVYDQEAGCLDIATVKNQIALTRKLDIVPIVNTPGLDHHLLALPLDCGALGVLIPMVQNRAEAEAIVRSTHYPPAGIRGVALGIAHDDYGSETLETAIAIANQRTLVAVKIETAQALEHVDEIVSVPGIDVAYLGHTDLSVSLGIPGQYTHRTFVAAVEHIVAACKQRGKWAGCLAADPEMLRQRLGEGFRFVNYSTDVLLLGAGFRAGVAEYQKR
jgi:2-keto-3-deoxy-L-rhamnonate aldolase RhmA